MRSRQLGGFPVSDATRLLEGARLFLVPGPQFAAAAQRRHQARWTTARGPTVKASAVVAEQPPGSHHLPHAIASVPEVATILVSGRDATLRGMIDALSTALPGRPGILHFAGHARAGQAGLPADAHLVLDGGFDDPAERLYARDLIRGRFPNLSIPRTVVLSACSTWGDDGAADWLGLASGLVWCGAKNVVATLWPIIDLPDAARVDRVLVERLATEARSPVDVVRDFQLDELARQRAAAWVEPEWGNELTDLSEQANSYLWAPFTVIVVADERVTAAPRDVPNTKGELPNDLLFPPAVPAPSLTSAGSVVSGERVVSPGEHHHHDTPAPEPPTGPAAVPESHAVLAFEYGPASSETQHRIRERCGFEASGYKVRAPKGVMTFNTFLRVTQAQEMPSPRSHAGVPPKAWISPTRERHLPYRVQSGTHVAVDDERMCAVIANPYDIDRKDVRPALMVGLAVGFLDVTSIEVEFVEVDSLRGRDELRDKRPRPSGVRPQGAWALTLCGGGDNNRLPFTVEIELDELSRRVNATKLYRYIGRKWARAHLARVDLTIEERTRLQKIDAEDWEYVVTWTRAIDTGSYAQGHEDDLVPTEWLLASLSPASNGTLGFDRPAG